MQNKTVRTTDLSVYTPQVITFGAEAVRSSLSNLVNYRTDQKTLKQSSHNHPYTSIPTHPPSHIHMHGETYLRYLEFQFIPLQRWIASFHYSCSSIDQCTKTLQSSKLVRTKYCQENLQKKNCQEHKYKMVWTITRYSYNIQNKLIALTTT